jgi:hypothetical protein
MFGCNAMILSAAARRSASDNGSPCVTFALTASKKASAGLPSKNSTSTVSCPWREAAIRRCIPSITCMVLRSTRIGGSGTPASASLATCPRSCPCNRGDSPGCRDRTGTFTITRSGSSSARIRSTATPPSPDETDPVLIPSTLCPLVCQRHAQRNRTARRPFRTVSGGGGAVVRNRLRPTASDRNDPPHRPQEVPENANVNG